MNLISNLSFYSHLDIETIDSLAEAINCYSGGVVLVSHDFRLIDKIENKQIWQVEKGTVKIYKDNIDAYKKKLIKEIREASK